MALVLLMLALLLGVGFSIGFAVYPVTDSSVFGRYRYFVPFGGLAGMGVAFLIWATGPQRMPRGIVC